MWLTTAQAAGNTHAWLASVYDLEYKMGQVLRDRRGVSVAAFYVASHGLFVVLLLRLLVYW